MHLSSGVVRKCDSSSSERQSTKVLLQKAVPTLTAFEGRKITLIKKKNKSLKFLLQKFWKGPFVSPSFLKI